MNKEDYDVSKVFLAYLAFLGNASKVAIALAMQPERLRCLPRRRIGSQAQGLHRSRHNDRSPRPTGRSAAPSSTSRPPIFASSLTGLQLPGSKDAEEMLVSCRQRTLAPVKPSSVLNR